MSWDALAALAELVGAFGVIASLLYLASQMRQGLILARAEAQDRATSSICQVTSHMLVDPEINALYLKSLGDWRELPQPERARVMHLFFQVMKASEDIHLSYSSGLLDEDTWSGWNELFEQYFATEGFNLYWQVRSDVFSRRFVEYVQALPQHPQPRTIGSLGLHPDT